MQGSGRQRERGRGPCNARGAVPIAAAEIGLHHDMDDREQVDIGSPSSSKRPLEIFLLQLMSCGKPLECCFLPGRCC